MKQGYLILMDVTRFQPFLLLLFIDHQFHDGRHVGFDNRFLKNFLIKKSYSFFYWEAILFWKVRVFFCKIFKISTLGEINNFVRVISAWFIG